MLDWIFLLKRILSKETLLYDVAYCIILAPDRQVFVNRILSRGGVPAGGGMNSSICLEILGEGKSALRLPLMLQIRRRLQYSTAGSNSVFLLVTAGQEIGDMSSRPLQEFNLLCNLRVMLPQHQ